MRGKSSPGLSSHLEMLVGEADRNLTLLPRILHEDLEIVHEPPHRSRAIRLHDTHIVAVEIAAGVLNRKLVGRHHVKPSRAVYGVEMRRNRLLVFHVDNIFCAPTDAEMPKI